MGLTGDESIKGEGQRAGSVGLVEEDLTGEIIGAAMSVHKELGPSLLESAYQVSMCHS